VLRPVITKGVPVTNTAARVGQLLNPTSIAIVGASDASWTTRMIANLQVSGYQGSYHFVNPRRDTVLGEPCYPTITDIPHPVDHALLLVRNTLVASALTDAAQAGVRSATSIAAGFEEAGPDGQALAAETRQICQDNGISLIGPNTAGWFNFGSGVLLSTVGFERQPVSGPIAAVCQSGGLTNAVVHSVTAKGQGIRFAVGSGNELVTKVNDYLEYFLEQEDIRVVCAIVERIPDPERFAGLARRALDDGKPILLLKLGRSSAAQVRAVAHTGAVAGADNVVDTFLRDLGVVRVSNIPEMVEAAGLLARNGIPRGPRTVFVGGSGGVGALFADEAAGTPIDLVGLGTELTADLAVLLDQPAHSILNPVDTTLLSLSKLVPATERVISSGVADIVVLEGDEPVHAVTPSGPQGTQWPSAAEREAIAAAAAAHGVFGVFLGTSGRDPSPWGVEAGQTQRLPVAHGMAGVQGLSRAIEYASRRAEVSRRPAAPRTRSGAAASLPDRAGPLSEVESKQLLQAYGIRTTVETMVSSGPEAEQAASALGFPVVLKVVSPDIPHKADVGGVIVGVSTPSGARAAYEAIMAGVGLKAPGARIDGVLVCEQVTDAVEMFVGIATDPSYGPIVVLGAGGPYIEILADTASLRPPFDVATAQRAIERLRVAPILAGSRGRPTADVAALAEAACAVGDLAADHWRRIAEMDINPLFVRAAGHGTVAGDALVVLRE
jgi:acetate---CoA ligase (ADP-forming)